jgi:hypothetical protein
MIDEALVVDMLATLGIEPHASQRMAIAGTHALQWKRRAYCLSPDKEEPILPRVFLYGQFQ